MIETMIIHLVLWISVTVVFVNGDIFDPGKSLVVKLSPTLLGFDMYITMLLYCAMCSGFWIGILGGLIIDPVWIPSETYILRIILNGFTVAMGAAATDRWIYGKDNSTAR